MPHQNGVEDTHGKDIGTNASPSPELGVFERYPPAQFTVAGRTFAFPVVRISESGGNRIVERERPFRDGAKLDDTGSKAKRWTLDAYFENTILEKDLRAINGGLALYPTVLNDLIFQFDVHETGDLVVPTVGKQRVRAESYTRNEAMDERDAASVTFVFVEDNEDKVDFRSITAPTANANARRLAQSTDLDAQSSGAWDGSLSDLSESMSDLEDQVNAPGEVAQDVDANAMRIQGNARRANRTFSEAGRPGRDLFNDPQNSRGPRKLARQQDLAGRESNKSRRGRPKLIEVVFGEDTTIFRVAAAVGQDPADLMAVNPELDPFFIPKLTAVKVFATESLLNGSKSSN